MHRAATCVRGRHFEGGEVIDYQPFQSAVLTEVGVSRGGLEDSERISLEREKQGAY